MSRDNNLQRDPLISWDIIKWRISGEYLKSMLSKTKALLYKKILFLKKNFIRLFLRLFITYFSCKITLFPIALQMFTRTFYIK